MGPLVLWCPTIEIAWILNKGRSEDYLRFCRTAHAFSNHLLQKNPSTSVAHLLGFIHDEQSEGEILPSAQENMQTLLCKNKQMPAVGEKSFTIPGGYVVPGFAIITILYVLSNLTRMEVVSISFFIAVMSLVYLVMRWWKGGNRTMPIG